MVGLHHKAKDCKQKKDGRDQANLGEDAEKTAVIVSNANLVGNGAWQIVVVEQLYSFTPTTNVNKL